ncbi:MAG TPA: carboxypeptidase-like regulatory domain-containing protein, partial [Pyrinomonadaceae bacterium]|nr:carboxypeptidase-like regulatory domain-containing protein [Pyrinomonadaceae bacterium]
MRTPVPGSFPRMQCFAATVILALLIVPTIVAQTQITTGTIQGTVLDANGAAVPGANVEIKNLDTNISRTLTTDEDGRFTALALQPGNYMVT